jgi:Ca-activated chloride channel family protein
VRFQNPQAFALLIPFLLLLAWSFKSDLDYPKQLKKIFSDDALKKLVVGLSFFRRKIKNIFLILAVFFLILAYARPQYGFKEETAQTTGLDIVVLLDLSTSMLAEDVVPNRLKKSIHSIKTMLDQLSGDRVGVVAFAGSAYPAIPLTTDYEFIKQTLESLSEKSISNQGTNLNQALNVAYGLLKRGGVNSQDENLENVQIQNGSSVLIVFSDGETHYDLEEKTINALKKLGVVAYAVGVGTQKGAPIPLRDDQGVLRGYKKDNLSNTVVTKLESKALEDFVLKLSGKFYYSTFDESEMKAIIDEVKTLNRNGLLEKKIVVYNEYFQIPLFIGIVFMILSLIIRDFNVKKFNLKNFGTFVVFLFLLLTITKNSYSSDAKSINEYNYIKNGIKYYEQGNYSDALREFLEAETLDPKNYSTQLNTGDALFMSGDLNKAKDYFSRAKEFSKNVNEKGKASFNLGQTQMQLKDYEGAIQTYQDALDSLYSDKKADSEIIYRLKAALEVAQNQKNEQKNQNKKDDKENKDNKDNQKNSKDNDKKDSNQDKNEKDKENQNYRMPKPKFKQENLSEQDAKRIMQQLLENEKKTQKKLMQDKVSRKAKSEQGGKDW